ncbi:hypothetical protein ACJIZ3_003705 [Penstemon smallii]|uniref:RNase H type-1 domain-containing protein n=1 Tax=Penstemon smallii TaxID=265156 RepID=A0ABD3U9Y5_9LAMI
MFAAALWVIWKSRNKAVFEDKIDHIRQVVSALKAMALDLERAFPEKGKRNTKMENTVKWRKPGNGWYKINTDGSVLTNTKTWVLGFTRSLGESTITSAELMAAREGLCLAWERRFQKVELELDSEVVITLIKHADTTTHPLGGIIEDCRRLLEMPWESRIMHTKRSGNTCADALAKMGHDEWRGSRIWEFPPENLLLLIDGDM